MGLRQLRKAAGIVARHLVHGQTNFLKSLFLRDRVYRPEYFLADHAAAVAYEMPLPPAATAEPSPTGLYIHPPRGRKGRTLDRATERFVEETRMGTSP
jgi:hypothetical protein